MAENLAHATIHTIDLPPDFSSNKDSDSSLPEDEHHLVVRRVLGREFKGELCEERIVQQHFADMAIIDFARIRRPTCHQWHPHL